MRSSWEMSRTSRMVLRRESCSGYLGAADDDKMRPRAKVLRQKLNRITDQGGVLHMVIIIQHDH